MTSDTPRQPTPQASPPPPPARLLDQVRQAARHRGHPEPAVAAFADWCRKFILFHGKRHPRELGLADVGRFLGSVAQTDKDPVRSIAAGREALDVLYREVLHLVLGELPCPRPPRCSTRCARFCASATKLSRRGRGGDGTPRESLTAAPVCRSDWFGL